MLVSECVSPSLYVGIEHQPHSTYGNIPAYVCTYTSIDRGGAGRRHRAAVSPSEEPASRRGGRRRQRRGGALGGLLRHASGREGEMGSEQPVWVYGLLQHRVS
jgi:hypothetical protein